MASVSRLASAGRGDAASDKGSGCAVLELQLQQNVGTAAALLPAPESKALLSIRKAPGLPMFRDFATVAPPDCVLSPVEEVFDRDAVGGFGTRS